MHGPVGLRRISLFRELVQWRFLLGCDLVHKPGTSGLVAEVMEDPLAYSKLAELKGGATPGRRRANRSPPPSSCDVLLRCRIELSLPVGITVSPFIVARTVSRL